MQNLGRQLFLLAVLVFVEQSVFALPFAQSPWQKTRTNEIFLFEKEVEDGEVSFHFGAAEETFALVFTGEQVLAHFAVSAGIERAIDLDSQAGELIKFFNLAPFEAGFQAFPPNEVCTEAPSGISFTFSVEYLLPVLQTLSEHHQFEQLFFLSPEEMVQVENFVVQALMIPTQLVPLPPAGHEFMGGSADGYSHF